LTWTAEKDRVSLIPFVMKTASEDARFKETAKLLDYRFNKFNDRELFPANYQKENESILSVTKGKQNKVEVATSEAISLPIEKGTKDKYELIYHIDQQHLNENN